MGISVTIVPFSLTYFNSFYNNRLQEIRLSPDTKRLEAFRTKDVPRPQLPVLIVE